MAEHRTLTITCESDIIAARMRVREFARELGLNTQDQAYISLATSSLAQALDLDEVNQGTICIDSLVEDERVGVRVICTVSDDTVGDRPPKGLGDVRWMVDRLTVDNSPPDGVRFTLVRWDGASQGKNTDYCES